MDSQASPAPPAAAAIEAARAEIDRIDEAMLKLIADRQRVADQLSQAKPAEGLPLRPAREVQLLRRLLAASEEKLEPEVVVEVWRALIAANIRRQKPVDVIVGAGPGQDALRLFDLARRHFGARTRVQRGEDIRAALNKATDAANVVAVVPWPGKTGAGMWWHTLTESRYHRLHVIAALPIRANAAGEEPEAAVVAQGVALEPAGGDATLGIAFDRHYKVQRAMNEAGMTGQEVARSDNKVLIKLDEFLSPDDPRGGLLVRAGLDQFRVVGSFARV
ncbi:MAG: chorismate mutase [Hyphomonadaceae bacterium]